MQRPTLLVLAGASGVLSLGLMAAGLEPAAPLAAAQAPAAASVAVELLASPRAADVVDAADAFLATLSDEQRAIAQIELKPSLAIRWTNFPGGSERRNGVFYRDLKPEQVDAAIKVAKVALGEEGFARYQEVRAADDAFAKGRGGRGPGGPGGPAQKKGGGPGGGGAMFGSQNYMIAFLGKPSKTTPWILQLGGHHLAINIYYKGTAGAATPYHVAAQPTVWKDEQGNTHDPLAPMRDSLHGLLASLTPEQSKQAKLEARFNDVYVGPQKDGKFPAKSEGVLVSELSDVSKDFVRKAIAAWTGDSPQGAAYMKLYEADLDKIRVSYSGTTDVGERGDYVRIDGPRVWIEFATQGSDHYHTIWRDRLTDYGAEFSF
ncbi:DUF3500 domain-containing protein [Paludisphaera rhizosphaerae]|uniref:DUF3500 domain-containing protein n=1 Tax=Paludisphaera rhizosphaerae TaxID=2711216 RepID=UPI0013ED38E6|nr:DUF3500 domain-containing protein [Paludisphaera rhizosphaerae]